MFLHKTTQVGGNGGYVERLAIYASGESEESVRMVGYGIKRKDFPQQASQRDLTNMIKYLLQCFAGRAPPREIRNRTPFLKEVLVPFCVP